MEVISKAQNAVISSIVSYGQSNSFGSGSIRVVRDMAYSESSLGRVSLSTKVGLFQYDTKTWNDVYPGKDINSQNDQIAAMFSEVKFYGDQFTAKVRAGDTFLANYTSEEYIDAIHHYHLGKNTDPVVTKAELDNAHGRVVKATSALGAFRLVVGSADYSDFSTGDGHASFSPGFLLSWQNFDVNRPHGTVTVSDESNYDSFNNLWKIP